MIFPIKKLSAYFRNIPLAKNTPLPNIDCLILQFKKKINKENCFSLNIPAHNGRLVTKQDNFVIAGGFLRFLVIQKIIIFEIL